MIPSNLMLLNQINVLSEMLDRWSAFVTTGCFAGTRDVPTMATIGRIVKCLHIQHKRDSS